MSIASICNSTFQAEVQNEFVQTQQRIQYSINQLLKIKNEFSFFTPAANVLTQQGILPDLKSVCSRLFYTFSHNEAPYSALQFYPTLSKVKPLTNHEVIKLKSAPEKSTVLVDNEYMKVILIVWDKGDQSSIHGHAFGGMYKVLHGTIQEKRYTSDQDQTLIKVSNWKVNELLYIDNQLAFHSVGNPFDDVAVSLHVYPKM